MCLLWRGVPSTPVSCAAPSSVQRFELLSLSDFVPGGQVIPRLGDLRSSEHCKSLELALRLCRQKPVCSLPSSKCSMQMCVATSTFMLHKAKPF